MKIYSIPKFNLNPFERNFPGNTLINCMTKMIITCSTSLALLFKGRVLTFANLSEMES